MTHLPPLGGHTVQVGVGQRRLGFDLPLRQHVMSDDGNPFLDQDIIIQSQSNELMIALLIYATDLQ